MRACASVWPVTTMVTCTRAMHASLNHVSTKQHVRVRVRVRVRMFVCVCICVRLVCVCVWCACARARARAKLCGRTQGVVGMKTRTGRPRRLAAGAGSSRPPRHLAGRQRKRARGGLLRRHLSTTPQLGRPSGRATGRAMPNANPLLQHERRSCMQNPRACRIRAHRCR